MQQEQPDACGNSRVTIWGAKHKLGAQSKQTRDDAEIVASSDDLFGAQQIFVITAWNPRSEFHQVPENRAGNLLLLEELKGLNQRIFEAKGASRDGSWAEESFAVLVDNLQDSNFIGAQIQWLATKYGQNAFFVITDSVFQVLGALWSGRSQTYGISLRCESV